MEVMCWIHRSDSGISGVWRFQNVFRSSFYIRKPHVFHDNE